MKLRAFLLLIFTLGLALSQAQAQCRDTPGSGACFRVFDEATRQEVTALCAGQRIRLRDCSGRPLDPKKTYYQFGSTTLCSGFADTTTTRTVPATPGLLVISQNTNSSAGTGIIFSRQLTVYATPAPSFSVTSCAPGRVQVAITDRTYDRFTVQIGSGPAQAVAAGTTASYAVPAGATTVRVRGSYAAAGLCSAEASQPLPTLPAPIAPQLLSLTTQNNGLQFTFGGLQVQYQYVLETADATQPGGYRRVAEVPGSSSTYTLTSPTTGCFRLRLTDACESVGARYVSAEGCAVQLTAAAAPGRNELRWTIGNSPVSFEVSRDGQVVARLAGSARSYTDASVVCGSEYAYRITAVNSPVTATSSEIRVRAVTGPPPPTPTLTASFDLRNRVVLTAEPAPAGSQATFSREQDNATVVLGTTQGTLRDSALTISPELPPCYTARLQDGCGQTSGPSAAACPVILTAREQETAGQSAVALQWTPLDAGRTTARYRLLLLAADGQVLRAQPVNGLETLDLTPPADRQVLRYRLEATTGSGTVSYSNLVTLVRPLRLVLPTAFTPNGDGLNDVLEVKGRFLTNYVLILRDRNGREVFRSTSRRETWDGRVNGAAPVPGVYVFRFEATDETGRVIVQNGSVTLLR
ncbi:gliding motility-associated C-terminal domain-containing protein [Hymenobacter sp. J193]|uniref:gliding motility-associated C-terminal domain-containing protein n=1 Tax=Hymenobacter sp. J193 TaxID=2898429 RepID=UPI0021513096|nr:gliding motility-associated C-terminal domain-containing protein [Hymenobacter sp. J193]MCR5889682.1 gliding motility-associated C-terminal domain-containing protein [Hymenobacter sp. J193]